MNEPDAKKYIKNLILTRSPLRDKALEHFEKAFGHPFWSKENTNRQTSTSDAFSTENFKK